MAFKCICTFEIRTFKELYEISTLLGLLNPFGFRFGEHSSFEIKQYIVFENNSCLIWLGYIEVMGKKTVPIC
jgi:hypothetical protein